MTRKLGVEISAVQEPWTVITLKNGDVLRSRTIITGVRQVLDDKGEQAFAPDGKPLYEVDSQMVFDVKQKVTLDA